jgi:WD40 repeat protein
MDETNSNVVADAAPSFPSFIALRAKHSELLQREPDSEHDKVKYLEEVEQFIKQVQKTGVILSDDEERRTSQNVLNYWVSTLYRQDQVARLVTLADFDRNWTSEVGDVVCPYPGVRAFTEHQSPFFFGRQRQIDYMVGRLKEDRLLVIVGPSGSGKTSLVQAGLLPALKKERPNGLEHFFFPAIVPGSDPLMTLALMIRKAKNTAGDDPDWLRQQIQRFKEDPGHLLNLIEEITDNPAVIFIDQGEELYERSVPKLLRPLENLFDLDNSRKTIEPILDNLVRVVQSPGKNHIVIIARRTGDYEPYTKRLPSRVREVFEPARVILPALYASELRDAIQKPAELLGCRFEEVAIQDDANSVEEASSLKPKETTVQALVKEISSEPVGLPLLQFILPQLWGKREGNKIPDQAFRDLGSCRIALTNTAEEFYDSLSSSDQRLCRRLLTHLVTLDKELKAKVYPVRQAALYKLGKQSQVERVVGLLVEKQLVRLTKGEAAADDWIELVHDSLISNWPTMSSWIEGKRRAQLMKSAARNVGIAAVILVFLSVVPWFVGKQEQKIKSRDFAALSGKKLSNNRLDLAMLLGLAAYESDINTSTRSNLHKLLYNLQFTPSPKRILRKENFDVVDLSFTTEESGAPRRLAAIDRDGQIVVWDLNWEGAGAKAAEHTVILKSSAIPPLAFSADGKTLATASSDAEVKVILWDLDSGTHKDLSMAGTTAQPAQSEWDRGADVYGLVFEPNGETLFSAGEDGTVIQWDIKNLESVIAKTIYQHPSPLWSIALYAKGDLLAASDLDGEVLLLDVSGKRIKPRVIVPGHKTETSGDEVINNVAFSANGELLAASQLDGVQIWNLQTKKLQQFYTGLPPTGLLVSFSDSDRTLTGYNSEGNILYWSVLDNVPLRTQLYKPAIAAASVAFSGNGRFIGLPSDNGVIVWDVSNQRSLTGGEITSFAFNPAQGGDNLRLAVGQVNGVVLWDTKNPDDPIEVNHSPEESAVVSIAYSPDGSVLAAGLTNGTISLRDPKTLKETGTLKSDQELTDGEEYAGVVKIVFNPTQGVHQLVSLVNLRNSQSEFSKIFIWDVDTGKQIAPLPVGENSFVSDLAFRPDGQLLLWTSTGQGNESTVAVWDAVNGRLLRTLKNTNVQRLAFSRGNVLAVGLDMGKVQIWNDAYQPIASLEAASEEVADLAFSPDGSILACATNPPNRRRKGGDSSESTKRPGTIILWDMLDKQHEQLGDLLRGNGDAISSLAFSPDGNILASAGEGADRRIVLWDVNVAGARDRVCTIIDCAAAYQEIQHLDTENLMQWFYRKTSSLPSLRERNQ